MTTACIAGTAGVFGAGVVVGLALAKAFCKCGSGRAANGRQGGAKKDGASKKQQRDERQFAKTHPAPADGSVEIYAGNLSYDMTEEQLNAEFVKFGAVSSARIIANRFNGKSKGFGFVIMPNRAEAEKAIAALEGKEIMGRPMKVNEARNLDKSNL